MNSRQLSTPKLKKIDELDAKMMTLMLMGHANKEISKRLKVPLSTVQRRTRRLVANELVSVRAEVNLDNIGIKRGMIHVYLVDGNIDQVARKISTFDAVTSVGIHIGNSDLIANTVYKDSWQLLQTISNIKELEGVDRILWSEEVYNLKNENNVIANMLGFES
jgi:DNA-binding Lrp family transcriptional regulator